MGDNAPGKKPAEIHDNHAHIATMVILLLVVGVVASAMDEHWVGFTICERDNPGNCFDISSNWHKVEASNIFPGADPVYKKAEMPIFTSNPDTSSMTVGKAKIDDVFDNGFVAKGIATLLFTVFEVVFAAVAIIFNHPYIRAAALLVASFCSLIVIGIWSFISWELTPEYRAENTISNAHKGYMYVVLFVKTAVYILCLWHYAVIVIRTASNFGDIKRVLAGIGKKDTP